MEFIFWIVFIGTIYSYFIYPVLLFLMKKRALPPSSLNKDDVQSVTLIITVHNEEARIAQKLDNALAIDYPSSQFEIIVASDASTDNTHEIISRYENEGVRLMRVDEHKGKEYAQWKAINEATGDILIFSDAATDIPKDAIGKMVRYFDDPAVGAVSSEDRFISGDGKVVGEGLYVRYEMWLRRMETEVCSLVGLSGSFFAARKSICDEWDVDVPSDFNTALSCVKKGYFAISAADVHGYYKDVKDNKKEFQRKVRTVLRGISALAKKVEVLNPLKFGIFSFFVWSHKIMRWLVPFFMVMTLLISAILAVSSVFYAMIFGLQLIFYGLVLVGFMSESIRNNTFIKIPFFFVESNIAIAYAIFLFLSGTRMTTWQPSKR
ncbi:MAG: glycosyltransferase family 2 protein [Gammaproteobacteria bacterium]|nr:glycosyltransferase family 2 protein [Gammaproteobacteria bacterium]